MVYEMKKDIIIFASNIIILFCAVGIVINLSPLISNELSSISSEVLKLSQPYGALKSKSQKVSLIFGTKKGNNNSTSQEETQEVMNSFNAEDGSALTDLTQTPDDIKALMEAEEQVIGSKAVKGKTSEESYTGGGTIVAYDNVQVQSKIPSDFYSLDIESLLNQKADLKIENAAQPTVLIYHSHTTECYTLLDVGFYTESTDLKTKDISRNMVRVGDEICKTLEARGVGVIHDREIHDNSYNEAYASSRKSVEEYLEKYPSIEITIDVHRDSITYKDGTKVKPTVEVNGKKAARMMIISGCQHGNIKNFDGWEYNLRFSTAVTEKINSEYQALMRPILFSERKYNMDLTKNSFLLEIGTEANTLDEACYSARLFANCLADLILEEYAQ